LDVVPPEPLFLFLFLFLLIPSPLLAYSALRGDG
jgi:hypothetical protein